MFVLTQGKFVEFYSTNEYASLIDSDIIFYSFKIFSLTKLYTFTMPCTIHSATIHPNKSIFVCGGEDFILYKYSIDSGIELGIWCNKKTNKKNE